MTRRPLRRIAGLAFALPALGLAAGCGTEPRTSSAVRPPSPITLSAVISGNTITVSPARFGAGPVALAVANLTNRAQRVTFETAGRGTGFRQQTGPINPRDTAQLQATLAPGQATVRVDDDSIRGATLQVGRERTSAQDDLLQP